MRQQTLIDKAFLLKATPLFHALDLDLLLAIADKLSLIVFEANDEIFGIGEDANRMYFIVKGRVEIYLNGGALHCTLDRGEFFGEESLFNNQPRSYQAFTPVETHVLTLSRSNLYFIISECPSVALGFLQVYTSKMNFRPFSNF